MVDRSAIKTAAAPWFELLEQRLLLSVIGFENAGDENMFVTMVGDPIVTRVAGNDGYCLDLYRNQGNGSVEVEYEPSVEFTLVEGIVGADVHLQYYNTIGAAEALILKHWDDDGLSQSGGYVATLQARDGNVDIWIGASKPPGANTENWEFYRESLGEGHTDFFTTTMTTYTPQGGGLHSLGWWNIEATMDVVGSAVQIDVTVTDGVDIYEYSWTDSGTNAVTAAGNVGLAVFGVWNIHGQFDNFSVESQAGLPEVTIAPTDASASEEGADSGTFRISRTGATDELEVHYTVGGSAEAGDYTQTLTGVATIGAGATYTDIIITPVDDADVEGDEILTLMLTGDAAYGMGSPSSADVTIADNDAPAGGGTVVTFDTSGDPQVSGAVSHNGAGYWEGAGMLGKWQGVNWNHAYGDMSGATDFTIDLKGAFAAHFTDLRGVGVYVYSGGMNAWNSFNLSVADYADFTTVTEALDSPNWTFSGGASSMADILADVTGIQLYGLPTSAFAFDNAGFSGGASTPTVTITATDDSATEGADDGNFVVTRTGSTNGNLVVSYTVSGSASAGDIVETLSGSVTIPDGSASVNIPITAFDDGDIESQEAVTLTLTSGAYDIGAADNATVNIFSDDLPTVTITATDPDAFETTQNAGEFTITRSGTGDLTVGNLTVNYHLGGSAEAGDIVESLGGSVTIPDGAPWTTISVTPIDDSEFESDETVTLALDSGAGYTVGGASSADVVIDSDDLRITALDSTAQEAGESSAAFRIERGSPTDGVLVIAYTVGGQGITPGDYESTGTVAISGEASSVDFGIQALDDLYIEPDEVMVVTLSPDPGYGLADQDQHIAYATIISDDLPEVSIVATDASASEEGQSGPDGGQFTITRSGAGALTAGALAVNYTIEYLDGASAGDIQETLTGSVEIPDGQQSVNLSITPVDDSLIESDESIKLTLAAGTVNEYTIDTDLPNATVLIAGDNDVPKVSITAGQDASEAGLVNGEFTVTRSGDGLVTQGPLDVHYIVSGTAAEGVDYASLGGTGVRMVTIPDTAWSTTITITPLQDADYELGESVTLELQADAANDYTLLPPIEATVGIIDDDDPAGVAQEDFETAGSDGDFVDILGAPWVTRVTGHGGHVLDMWKGNSVGSVKYSPQGDYMLGEGTVSADVNLRYYQGIGSPHSLIVKGWEDVPQGGYVVTLLPINGDIQLWIGASNGPGAGVAGWEWFNSASGHTNVSFTPQVATYDQDLDQAINEIGWWNVSAKLEVVNGTDVKITVTLTDEDGNVYDNGGAGYVWTDTGANVETGEGTVGLSVCGYWGIHGQFDNFTVIPAGETPVLVTVEVDSDTAAEAGPTDGTFKIHREDTTNELRVYYRLTGTATDGVDYSVAGVTDDYVLMDVGVSEATVTITPLHDDFDEGAETVRFTALAGLGYIVNATSTARLAIADNDAHSAETVLVDFETGGQDTQFVPRGNLTSKSLVGGNYGQVLDMFRSNSSGLAVYDPDGDGYTMTIGKVGVDVHLQYVSTGAGYTIGSPVALVLKEWTDDRDQYGGYVVTLMPDDGEIKLWIGASNQPGAGFAKWDFYRSGAAGHSKPLSTDSQPLASYTEDTSAGVHSLGWWRIDAAMSIVPVGGKDCLQIDVTLTDDQGVEHIYSWTDAKKASFIGAAPVGLSVHGLWSIHGQYDNFTIVPDDATNEPPVANAGPDQTVVLPAGSPVSLSGAVSDDVSATASWIKLSGPDATINSPASASASVDIATGGVYVFQLSADDGTYIDADTVTITALPEVGFVTSGSSGNEGVASPVITVQLSATSVLPVTVDYSVHSSSSTATEGEDFDPVAGTLTFAPGGATSLNIPLTIIDELLYESDETVTLVLTGETNAAMGVAVYTYTILDDDIELELAMSGPTVIQAGAYTLDLAIFDPAYPLDHWLIDWDDGTAAEQVGGGATSATHLYSQAGEYVIQVQGVDSVSAYMAAPVVPQPQVTVGVGGTQLTPGGSVVTILDDADDESVSIDLGANTFTFGHTQYTGADALFVSPNGLISLGAADTSYANDDLSAPRDHSIIAAFWDDLRTNVDGNDKVLYDFSTPDWLIIQWDQVWAYAGGDETLTFQAALQLNTGDTPGEVELAYFDLTAGLVDVDDGASATVGLALAEMGLWGEHLISFNGSSTDVATGMLLDIGAFVTADQIELTVDPSSNSAPVLTDLAVGVDEDSAVWDTVAATDAEGDALVFSVASQPTDGEVLLDPLTGSFRYESNMDFAGQDTFTLQANDGALDSNAATVTVTVNEINDAPLADEQAVTTAVDQSIDITLTGDDIETPASLTYELGDVEPQYGDVTINGDVVTYVPGAGFNGVDVFDFKVHDGTDYSEPAYVQVTVNTAPVASDVTGVTTDEDTSVDDITLSATDADGAELTFEIVTDAAYGTVTLADNVATYTPDANYNDADSFTFVASDGISQSNEATVSIAVSAVPDVPVALEQTVYTGVDTPIDITLTAYDAESDPVTFALAGVAPTKGGVALNVDTVTYTPTVGQFGVDTFSFTAADATGTSAEATITVVINDVPTVDTAAAATPAADPTQAALSVLGADEEGEAALSYTWSVLTAPDGAATPELTFATDVANGDNAARDATATFYVAGSYDFRVTITDSYGQSVTSDCNIDVSQELTIIVVTAAVLAVSTDEQLTAFGYDQFGEAMAPALTWDVQGTPASSVTLGGLFSAGAVAEDVTVEATSGGVTGSAAVRVAAGPSITTAASATMTSTPTEATLSVVADDDQGESSLIYSWVVLESPVGAASPELQFTGDNHTNPARVATAVFAAPGWYRFEVTIEDADGMTVSQTATIEVTAQAAALTLSATDVMVAPNATHQFTANSVDQFGADIDATGAITWSVTTGSGSIDANTGLYTAGATEPGSATVQASMDTGGAPITAETQVTVSTLQITTPAAVSADPVTGTTADLSVLGDCDGGESTLTYTWSLDSGPGAPTFDENDSNAAKSTTVTFDQIGEYVFGVTVTDSLGASLTSSVAVTVEAAFTAVTITSESDRANPGLVEGLEAVAEDQFGAPMATQPDWTWDVTPVGGGWHEPMIGVFIDPDYTGASVTVSATGDLGGDSVDGSKVLTINEAPTVATAISVSSELVTGTTVDVSILGADDGANGEDDLTYSWSFAEMPSADASVDFSEDDGTHEAASLTMTFSEAGEYVLYASITDAEGLETWSDPVTITVQQTFISVGVSPDDATLEYEGSVELTASALDQFGDDMVTQPTWTWSVDAGGPGGQVDAAGLYIAPEHGLGVETVRAVSDAGSGSIPGTAEVVVNFGVNDDQSVAEGTEVSLDAVVFDPDCPIDYTYDWSVSASNGQSITPGTDAKFTFTPNDNGVYTVTCVVTSTENQQTAVDITVVNVYDEHPVVTITGGSETVDEGATYTLTIEAPDDPGDDVVTLWTIDWGDGSALQEISVDAATVYPFDVTHEYDASHPQIAWQRYDISAEAESEDDVVASAQAVVHVRNLSPITPTGLLAQVRDDGRVEITWTASPRADSYRLTRTDEYGGEKTYDLAAVQFVDGAGLKPGATYTYSVTALAAASESDPSNISFVVIPHDKPNAPVITSATASRTNGQGKVTLTWSAVEDADSYVILRSTTDSGLAPGRYTTVDGFQTTFEDTYVLDGAEYRYIVAAVSNGLISNDSAEATALTILAPPKLDGASFRALYGDAYFSWGYSSVVDTYDIYRNTQLDSAGATWLENIDGLATDYNDINVDFAETYYYWVKAVNGAGESEFSGPVQAQVALLPAPTDVRVYWEHLRYGGPYAVTVHWMPVEETYRYKIYLDGEGFLSPLWNTPWYYTHAFPGEGGVEKDTDYTWQVSAIDEFGLEGALSAPAEVYQIHDRPTVGDSKIYGNTVEIAEAKDETDTQYGMHGFSLRLDSSQSHDITISGDFYTYDMGSGADPYGNALFSVSVNDSPLYTKFSDIDPADVYYTQGGATEGDLEQFSVSTSINLGAGSGWETQYLHVYIDTDPDSDYGYAKPSWGTFTVDGVEFFHVSTDGFVGTAHLDVPMSLWVNDDDDDGDGIPDFADGFNRDDNGASPDLGLDDSTANGDDFYIFGISLAGDTPYDCYGGYLGSGDQAGLLSSPSDLKLRFTYAASAPGGLDYSNAPWSMGASDWVLADPYVHTLPADNGYLRIWIKGESEDRDSRPVEEGGDFIVPGVEYTWDQVFPEIWALHVEGIRPSQDPEDLEIQVEVIATYEGTEYIFEDVRSVIVFGAGLTIDADNDNGAALPDGDAAEDQVENVPIDAPAGQSIIDYAGGMRWGKDIPVHIGDRDEDGVPDWADGYNLDGVTDSGSTYSSDDIIADLDPANPSDDPSPFVPVIVTLPAVLDLSTATLDIFYNASDPNGVVFVPVLDGTGFGGFYELPAGTLRLWQDPRADVSEEEFARSATPFNAVPLGSAGSNYVPSGTYGPEEIAKLGFSDTVRSIRFLLERVKSGPNEMLELVVDTDGQADGWWAEASDSIWLPGHFGDLQVDSNNDSQIDDADDQLEDVDGQSGKIIAVNSGDKDNDGTPDFADGYVGSKTSDPSNDEEYFTPLTFTIPDWVNLDPAQGAVAKFSFTYDASDPALVHRIGDDPTKENIGYVPAEGSLRIWKWNAGDPRDPRSLSDGNFVASGTPYTAEQLGYDLNAPTERTIELGVEAVRASKSLGDLKIKLFVDLGGNPNRRQLADVVRLTAIQPMHDPAYSGAVRLADGVVTLGSTDLATGGYDGPWAHGRTITTDPLTIPDLGLYGNNVFLDMPRLIHGGDSIIVLSGGNMRVFDRDGSTSDPVEYIGRFGDKGVLRPAGQLYQLIEADGSMWQFYGFDSSYKLAQKGGLSNYWTPGNDIVAYVAYAADGRINEIWRAPLPNADEKYVYEYYGPSDGEDGAHSLGMLKTVRVERNDEIIQGVGYAYYKNGEAYGNLGDLKAVFVDEKHFDPAVGWDKARDVTYYRYETPSGAPGPSRVTLVIGPDAYQRMLGAKVKIDLATASDVDLLKYADYRFEYYAAAEDVEDLDRNRDGVDDPVSKKDAGSVAKQWIAGHGASGTNGQQDVNTAGEYIYTYTENVHTKKKNSDVHDAVGFNIWQVETKETRPNITGVMEPTNTFFTNFAGQLMLTATKGEGLEGTWHSFLSYDKAGRLVLAANPSAVEGYDKTLRDLLGKDDSNYAKLRDDEGLVSYVKYYASTNATLGWAAGYVEEEGLRHGELGQDVKLRTVTYGKERTYANITLPFMDKETIYADENGTESKSIVTSYEYNDWTGFQPTKITTTLSPVVQADEVADGDPQVSVTYTTVQWYDDNGRMYQSQDADDKTHKWEFDEATGAVTKTIVDFGGLNLTTVIEVDDFGRPELVIAPDGGSMDYIYEETNDLTSTTIFTLSGAVSETVYDRQAGTITRTLWKDWGQWFESEKEPATVTPLSKSVDILDLAGRLVETHDYYKADKYYKTYFAFDALGRAYWTKDPVNIIRKTTFDALSRPAKQEIKQEQEGLEVTTFFTTNSYEYDNGGVGDGLLTESRVRTGALADRGASLPAATRVVRMAYDWRNRMIATVSGINDKGPDSPQVSYLTLDNLGQATSESLFEGLHDLADANNDGVPDAPPAASLRAKTEYELDALGRMYRTKQYKIDQTFTDGKLGYDAPSASGYMTTQMWYDGRGNVLMTCADGGPVIKRVYDAIGRVTAEYVSNGAGGLTADMAQDVSGDIVLQQTQRQYGDSGGVAFQTVRERFHNATGTGALAAADSRASYTAYYYDPAGRLTDTVDHGTNGGKVLKKRQDLTKLAPNGGGAGTQDYLRTNRTYDAAGNVLTAKGPANVVTKYEYDWLGRVTKKVEVYKEGVEILSYANRTTKFTYDGLGRPKTVTQELPGGYLRRTTHVYGKMTASGTYTHTIKRPANDSGDSGGSVEVLDAGARFHSDGEVVNWLGETVLTRNGDGVAHTLKRDAHGRVVEDEVWQLTMSGGAQWLANTRGTGGWTWTPYDLTVADRIKYKYDSYGSPYKTTSYKKDGAGKLHVVSEVVRLHNSFGQLIAEKVAMAEAVTTITGALKYTYGPASEGSRLLSMTYPGSDGPTINYEYDGLDAQVGRVTRMKQAGQTLPLEEYAYLGPGRVVEIARSLEQKGGVSVAIVLSYVNTPHLRINDLPVELIADGGDQYTGLDRFGRVVDQNWSLQTTYTYRPGFSLTSLEQLDRFQYGYTAQGQVAYRKNLLAEDLSEVYTYHPVFGTLERLHRGVLAEDGSSPWADHTTRTGLTYNEHWGRRDAKGQAFWYQFFANDGGSGKAGANAFQYYEPTNQFYIYVDFDGSTGKPKGGKQPRIQRNTTVDAWGRITSIRTKRSPGGPLGGYTTTNTYDALGRMYESEMKPSPWAIARADFIDKPRPEVQQWRYTYDAGGRTIRRTNVRTSEVRDIVYSAANPKAVAVIVVGASRLYPLQDASANVTAVVASVDNQWQVDGRYIFSITGEPTYLSAAWAKPSPVPGTPKPERHNPDKHNVGILFGGAMALAGGFHTFGGSAMADMYIGGAPSDTGVPRKSWVGRTMDWASGLTVMGAVHGGLDAIGFFPVAGDVVDLIHAGIYGIEAGVYQLRGLEAQAAMSLVEAQLTFASALPIIGDIGAKPLKWGLKKAFKTGVRRLVIQKTMQYAGGAIGRQIDGDRGEYWGGMIGNFAGAMTNAGMALRRGVRGGINGRRAAASRRGAGAYRGGAYSDLDSVSGQARHHMPADSVSPISQSAGPAIQMDWGGHMRTSSYGSYIEAAAYRGEIGDLIRTGQWRKAMAIEIRDVRRVALEVSGDRTKYNAAIREMLAYMGWLRK